MQFFRSEFIYTPSYFGGWLNWFYGFIITLLLIDSFAYFFLFQKETKIHLPLWLYLVFWVLFPFTTTTLSFVFLPIIFSVLIYFFVSHRQLSFNYIATNTILAFFMYDMAMATIGPLIMGLYGSIFPQTVNLFNNFGSGPVKLVELLVAYLVLKRINPLLHRYTKTVVPQMPIWAWFFNLFLLGEIVFRTTLHNYLNPLIYVFSILLYSALALLFIKLTTKYYHWKNMATNEQTELQNLRTYTSHIESMYDDLRRFRHDYKNILLSLGDAIKTGSIEEVRDIFDRVVQPTNLQLDNRTAVLSHLTNIENLEIKSIVYSKVITAINEHLDVTVEVAEPFKIPDKVEITDAIRIISILFDNAIAAAKDSPDKQINFSLFTKANAHYIVVRNSTKEATVNLRLLNGTFRGSLHNRHSLGLRNLRIILAAYPFIQHNCQSINHTVTQEIIIH